MPTVIKLIPNLRSKIDLKKYLKEKGINGKSNLHSTIFYTQENPIYLRKEIHQEILDILPITIIPPYKFDIFGNNLILRYSSDEAQNLRKFLFDRCLKMQIGGPTNPKEFEILKEYLDGPQVEFAYPSGDRLSFQKTRLVHYEEFNPHITLAKEFKGDIENLTSFEEEIIFKRFDWKV